MLLPPPGGPSCLAFFKATAGFPTLATSSCSLNPWAEMKAVLFLLLVWFAPIAAAESISSSPLLVADAKPGSLPARGIKITYLGTNGYLLESRDTTIVVDPYFTRVPLWRVALGLRMETSDEARGLMKRHCLRKVDGILVTHAHFDHLLDAPWIGMKTRAPIIASPTGAHLATAAGAPKVTPVLPGKCIPVGGARVQVLKASHDCLLWGKMPFPGELTETPPPPRRPSDWVCGEPLAFLIEMGGQRIYIDSGGTPDVIPPADLGRIDLAILGVALEGGRQRLPETLARLKPRYFLPSHQDNFFSPLRRGYRFGPLTNFREVKRRSQGQHMIVLDYFKPWTLR